MHRVMRNLYVLFLLLALPMLSLAADAPEAGFVKGNAFYAKGKYKEAVAAYQQVLDAGYSSAGLYFNLGNAYYKLDEIPLAILNYEKAHKASPGDEDISVNIQLANLKIKDKIEAVPEFFLAKWWQSFLLFCSAELLSILAVSACLVGFALLIVYLFAVALSVKRPAFYAGICLLVLALLMVLVAGLQTSYLDSSNGAVVFDGTVNVKSGPKDSFKTLYVVHEGLKVSIKEENDGWAKVELPNGNVGWLALASVKKI